MKIIVSHDVDHIDVEDHLLKDLIIPKIVIRSAWEFITGKITFKTFCYRETLFFRKRMNRIAELMEYDKCNDIPSTFFFGMDKGLGMSYSMVKAQKYINIVKKEGFDVGVHGVNYLSQEKIDKEYYDFKEISGLDHFGIRNHYLRFNGETFIKMNRAGYLYDTTYYDKVCEKLKNPYKVEDMWEFPLHIMDVYVCKHGGLDNGLAQTYQMIDDAEKEGIKYLTLLFHDYQFDDVFDPQMKEWYVQTIRYCKKKGYRFISYMDAIKELEHG